MPTIYILETCHETPILNVLLNKGIFSQIGYMYSFIEKFSLFQDFECDIELKTSVIDFLEEMVCNSNLLPAEHKAAASILRTLTKETTEPKIDLIKLLAHPEVNVLITYDGH